MSRGIERSGRSNVKARHCLGRNDYEVCVREWIDFMEGKDGVILGVNAGSDLRARFWVGGSVAKRGSEGAD